MKIEKSVLILLLFFVMSTNVDGQSKNLTFHAQLTFNIGAPVMNIGTRIISRYAFDEGVEISLGSSFTWFLNDYGPSKNHLESTLLGGVHYGWEEQYALDNIEEIAYLKYLDDKSSKFSVGYIWERFFNKIGTSQNIGTFMLRSDDYIFMTSNDVFANTDGNDRFRTGSFSFGVLEGKEFYSVNVLIWTGATRCEEAEKVRETDFPSRWGYKDISDCPYGKLSHGILNFGYSRDIGSGQRMNGTIGVDSDHIRNVIQNKVFHDMYFLPRAINKTKNLHLPMKTKDGQNFLYMDGQKVRPTKFIWEIGMNSSTMF